MREACGELLRLDPGHADAHFLLGIEAAERASFAEAAEKIGRAITLDPRRADYHAQHARCFSMLKRDDDALAAAQRCLALEPAEPLALDTVGVVLSKLGLHAPAAAVFRKAVALQPENPAYLYNLGTSLRFTGDFDGAEDALERAVQANPKLYRAHHVLSELRTQTPSGNHLERLDGLLAAVGDDVDGELLLRHAIAKEHEDLGDFETAFRHLKAGKARKRAAVGYSFDVDRALFETVEAVCTEALLAEQPRGIECDEPIFVVGMPRTGTTLVERILASHPDVLSAGELQHFAITVKRVAGTRSPRVLDPETIHAAAHADFAAVGERYLRATRSLTGSTPRFVDKMPLNFFYVLFISLALPKAKIVCLRRDPLDTCIANFRRLFALDFPYYHYAYDLEDIGRYYIRYDRLMRRWRRLLPDRFLEVHYEELVQNPVPQTRRLFELLGIEWQEDCLRFHENPAPVATASAVEVRNPLHQRSIGRWRSYRQAAASLGAQLLAAGIEVELGNDRPAPERNENGPG